MQQLESETVTYNGFLEMYNRRKVGGWAIASDSEIIPELEVHVNHEYVATFKPDIMREDLGRNQAGFIFEFADDLFAEDEKIARIDVKFKVSGKSLQNSPAICSINADDKNKVLIGKDGILFLVGDSNNVINQIIGDLKIPQQSQVIWQEVLFDRKEQIEKRMLPLVHLVIPDKERVYADKLPENIMVSNNSTFEQWRQLLPSSFPVIYPLTDFIEKRKTRDTYSKGDTHWNDYGAYICYQAVCRMLSEVLSEHIETTCLADESFHLTIQNADLLGMLGGVCIENQIKIAPDTYQCHVVNNNGSWLTGRQIHYRSTNSTSCPKRLLVFHDSFGPYMERLLASTFVESKFIWNADVLWEEVDAFAPDIILIEQVERFLIRPPK